MKAEPRCCGWRTIALAVAAVGLLAGAGWWVLTGTTSDSGASVESPTTGHPPGLSESRNSDAPAALPPSTEQTSSERAVSTSEERPIVADAWPSHSLNPPNLEFQQGEPTWETEMKVILRSRVAPTEQARQLLDRLRTVPPEAYSALVETAASRLPDQDYNSVALPILLEAKTDGAILMPLLTDLLERPDPIALPALLRIAQTPNHPLAPSALDTLALLVGADHGQDWMKWQAAVAQAVKASPER
jgi:hypothetical protein